MVGISEHQRGATAAFANWMSLMLNRVLVAAAGIAMLYTGTTPAFAATIINNPLNGVDGSCAFATVCGAAAGAPNPYAAQAFSVATPTVLTSASLTSYIQDYSQSFSINWEILSATADGLPGTIIASGASALSGQTYLGEQFGLSIFQSSFDVAATLSSGSYYFALQAVTSAFDVYLATADGTGAAYAADGETWTAGYAAGTAVAVSVSGESSAAVPEISTWAMMLVGFGLAGFAIRRRRAAITTRVSYAR